MQRILNTLRTDEIGWSCSFHFRYVKNKIVLICKFFFLPEPTVINLFWILQVSAVGLGNWNELFGCFIKANLKEN